MHQKRRGIGRQDINLAARSKNGIADPRCGLATHIVHRDHAAHRRRIGFGGVQADKGRDHRQNAGGWQLEPLRSLEINR